MEHAELVLQITPYKTSHNSLRLAAHTAELHPTPPHDLLGWGALYLQEEVLGVQAHNTLMAKLRDLRAFLAWYCEHNGHLAAEAWASRDTAAFCAHLEALGRAPTTINRALATLRRFARFIHDRHRSPFSAGLPTRGVKPLVVHQPPAQKLTGQQLHLLIKAASVLVFTERRANARPRRNQAALLLLLHTGLRVSELCALDLDQYQGKHLLRVVRKGRTRADLFVAKAARAALDEYLREERPLDAGAGARAPLLLTSRGERMDRRYIGRALDRISQEACKHHPEDRRFSVHPHQLRHTFASLLHAKTGSDARTAELLGHSSTKYVARYTKLTDQENQALLEDLFL